MLEILTDPNVIDAIRDLLLALVAAVVTILTYHRTVIRPDHDAYARQQRAMYDNIHDMHTKLGDQAATLHALRCHQVPDIDKQGD